MSNYNQLILGYQDESWDSITITGDNIRSYEYQGQGIVYVEVPECVVEINHYAFCDNFLSSITLNEGLQIIGDQAFQHGTYSSVTIPSTVTYIGENSFNIYDEQQEGAGDLYITCLATTPPQLEDYEEITFGDPSKLHIIVPDGSVNDYKASWSQYASIIQGGAVPPTPVWTFEKAYVGDAEVEKCYLGNILVYSAGTGPVPPEPPAGDCECTGDWPNCIPCSEFPISSAPLTYQILSAGTIHLRMMPSAETQAVCEYKVYNTEQDYYDNVLHDAEDSFGTHEFWNVLSASSEPNQTSSIDVQPGQYVAIRANKGTQSWCLRNGQPLATSAYANIFSGTAIFNIMGNMMSLNFPVITGPDSYIDWTTRADFSGSTFRCSLVDMFFGSHVVSAKYLRLPDYVPSYGFGQIFYNCADLVEAPQLHNQNQTQLPTTCYMGLFGNCTSLTTAPELLHNGNMQGGCYQYMFSGCTNLNYVKCLETGGLTGSNFTRWMIGVSPTGTFVKHPNATNWPRNESGIPAGWTVIDAVI